MNTGNPWSPTTKPLADAELPPVTVVRKPVAVWILQGVCVLALVILVGSIYTTIGRWREAAGDGMARPAYLISMGLQIILMMLLATTIVASQRRSRLGQWLGAIYCAGMMVVIVLNAGLASPGSGLSAGALAGRYTVDGLFFLLPALLLWFATFSGAARAWYARS